MSQQIESSNKRIVDAAGNVEKIASMFTDDAVLLPPNDSALFGRDEILSWWKEYFEFFKIASSVETEREVSIAGDQAFDRTAFTVTIVPKEHGARIHDDIRSLTVWRLNPDGEWKISHQIWNSTKPVGSGTNRYMTRMLQKKGSRSPR
jgi:ketosteroid isomerase-like protein